MEFVANITYCIFNMIKCIKKFLQVWDEQGKPSAPDTVTVTVDPDPNHLEVIEAVLDEPVSSLTLAKLDQVCSLNQFHSVGFPQSRVRINKLKSVFKN